MKEEILFFILLPSPKKDDSFSTTEFETVIPNDQFEFPLRKILVEFEATCFNFSVQSSCSRIFKHVSQTC
jgi:hypothetical protein